MARSNLVLAGSFGDPEFVTILPLAIAAANVTLGLALAPTPPTRLGGHYVRQVYSSPGEPAVAVEIVEDEDSGLCWATIQCASGETHAALRREMSASLPGFSRDELVALLEEEPNLASFYVALGLILEGQAQGDLPGVFLKGLAHYDPEVRMSALKGMTLAGNPAVAGILRTHLRTEGDSGLRSAITEALSRIPPAST